MKPRVMVGLLAFGIFGATPLFGQTVEIGPKIGLSWADMLGEDSGRAMARKGYTAGGTVLFRVSESFQVQVEGLYTQKGAQFPTLTGQLDVNTSYIEIPVLARLLFPRRADNGTVPYLMAGPAFSFENNCSVENIDSSGFITTTDCESSSFQPFQDTETLDVGTVVGGGLNVAVGSSHSFHIEGRLNVGVRSLDNTSRESDVRNVSFQLLSGFTFGFGG